MSNRQQKKARAMAFQAASNQKLWQQGKAELLALKWYYPLWYRISKKFKTRADIILAHWYKANLKNMADQAIAQANDPDQKEMARARRRMAKRMWKDKAQEWWDKRRADQEKSRAASRVVDEIIAIADGKPE